MKNSFSVLSAFPLWLKLFTAEFTEDDVVNLFDSR